MGVDGRGVGQAPPPAFHRLDEVRDMPLDGNNLAVEAIRKP